MSFHLCQTVPSDSEFFIQAHPQFFLSVRMIFTNAVSNYDLAKISVQVFLRLAFMVFPDKGWLGLIPRNSIKEMIRKTMTRG